MNWPIEDTPTWAERQTYGPQLLTRDVANIIRFVEGSPDMHWGHIHVLATMRAESDYHAWARPMVWSPTKPHHLSVDRGLCALNSYWWSHVPDVIAYDPGPAMKATLDFIKDHAAKGTKGASVWDWRPVLDWQWHGYGTDNYTKALPDARSVVNAIRREEGLAEV